MNQNGDQDNVSKALALFYWLSLVVLSEDESLSRNNIGKSVLQRFGADQIDYLGLTHQQALKLANNALLMAANDGSVKKERNKYLITELGLEMLEEGEPSTARVVRRRLS